MKTTLSDVLARLGDLPPFVTGPREDEYVTIEDAYGRTASVYGEDPQAYLIAGYLAHAGNVLPKAQSVIEECEKYFAARNLGEPATLLLKRLREVLDETTPVDIVEP